ncbi:39931_t:CDS:1, partial [Gigaspora margarita]
VEIYETITNWKNNPEFLSEFSKFDKEVIVKNTSYNIDGITIHNSKFIGYIEQKLKESVEINNINEITFK